MGKSNKIPAPPSYIQPQPISNLMPSNIETNSNNQRISYLSNFDNQIGNFRNPDSLFQQNIKDRMDSLLSQGKQNISNLYDPMFAHTQQDVYNRLGSLNTTDLAKSYNDIEKQRSQAVSNLVNYLIQDKQNQENNYLGNLINAQNTLMNGTQNYNNKLSNAYSMGLNYANAQNSFDLNNYRNQLNYSNLMDQPSLLQKGISWINPLYGAIIGYNDPLKTYSSGLGAFLQS